MWPKRGPLANAAIVGVPTGKATTRTSDYPEKRLRGKATGARWMPPLQYVILWHDGIPAPHFDVMFETFPGSDLSTWRSPAWPIGALTPLTRLKDHRRAYLKFEGPLTNHRGRVQQVAAGACRVEVVRAQSGESSSSPGRIRSG